MAYIPIIDIPKCNPIKLVRATNVLEYFFEQKIPHFETQVGYYQPFEQRDYIQFQLNINTSIINKYGLMIQLRSCDTNLNYGNFLRVGDIFLNGSYSNMTFKLGLYNPIIPAGDYYVYVYCPFLTGSNFELLYSEPITIAATHQGSIKLRYSNDGADFNMFFYENHNYLSYRYFEYRVYGGFRSDGFAPASSDAAFIDQTVNPVQLSSTPFYKQKLTLGDNYGIPNYQAYMINMILSCSRWYVDGVQYSKADGAQLERKQVASNHPLNYWQIDIMPSVNAFSDIITSKLSILPYPGGGIGHLQIGTSFVISPKFRDVNTYQQPITNGAFKPLKPLAVPELIAGVETEVPHYADMQHVMWKFRDVTNRSVPQFSVEEISQSNPRNAITVRSEITIPAGTLLLDVVGYNES